LIREGIEAVTEPARERVFHSMGVGDNGDPTLAERTDKILRKDWARRLEQESGS
jgi:hypothetical protein